MSEFSQKVWTFDSSRMLRPVVKHGWGILNPYGNIWTDKTFESPEEAYEYLKAFWKKATDRELQKFKIVRVTKTVAVEPEPMQQVRVITAIRNKDLVHD